LRRQLEAMPDGGVFAIHIPKAPYRCLPAPYERACLVAQYFAARKKRSKVLVLDANDDVQAEKALFTAAWEGRYKGLVEYRPDSELVDVDVASMTAKLEFDDVAADVLNVIPPQSAGAIARQLGMANANARFCQVDFLSYESTVQKNIHVLGDSIQTADLMPRSGHTASQQGKVCAAAVVALFAGGELNPVPVVASACYSFIDDREAAQLASVHRYDPEGATMRIVPESSVASAPSAQEAVAADAWARDIWADMLT
jgi:sulfide dehydrogenase [flavocytochrome c] flavoprotein subunit